MITDSKALRVFRNIFEIPLCVLKHKTETTNHPEKTNIEHTKLQHMRFGRMSKKAISCLGKQKLLGNLNLADLEQTLCT